jgi:hypothetical protein
MEPESNNALERFERQRDSDVLQAERAMSRRLDHVRYFYEHILRRYILRRNDCEVELKTQSHSIRTELEYKNKLLHDTANVTARDFDRALQTLEANHLTLLGLKDTAIQTLETQLKDTRNTFAINSGKVKTVHEKQARHTK